MGNFKLINPLYLQMMNIQDFNQVQLVNLADLQQMDIQNLNEMDLEELRLLSKERRSEIKKNFGKFAGKVGNFAASHAKDIGKAAASYMKLQNLDEEDLMNLSEEELMELRLLSKERRSQIKKNFGKFVSGTAKIAGKVANFAFDHKDDINSGVKAYKGSKLMNLSEEELMNMEEEEDQLVLQNLGPHTKTTGMKLKERMRAAGFPPEGCPTPH